MRELNNQTAAAPTADGPTMMTAADCRAKADELARAAVAETHHVFVVELESMARQWRKVARMADWQEAIMEPARK